MWYIHLILCNWHNSKKDSGQNEVQWENGRKVVSLCKAHCELGSMTSDLIHFGQS